MDKTTEKDAEEKKPDDVSKTNEEEKEEVEKPILEVQT